MENMWDVRFSGEEFIYGKEPNSFFREKILKMEPGRLLLPGEGEGRNAVFAALSGWEVVAFDSSVVGKSKAEKYASEQKVGISYHVDSYDTIELEENSFDMVALIYAHSVNREQVHEKMLRYLKPGGVVLLEGFSKEQINNRSGGPGRLDMLYSLEEIEGDFSGIAEKEAWIEEVILDEGAFHSGKASLLRMFGKK